MYSVIAFISFSLTDAAIMCVTLCVLQEANQGGPGAYSNDAAVQDHTAKRQALADIYTQIGEHVIPQDHHRRRRWYTPVFRTPTMRRAQGEIHSFRKEKYRWKMDAFAI